MMSDSSKHRTGPDIYQSIDQRRSTKPAITFTHGKADVYLLKKTFTALLECKIYSLHKWHRRACSLYLCYFHFGGHSAGFPGLLGLHYTSLLTLSVGLEGLPHVPSCSQSPSCLPEREVHCIPPQISLDEVTYNQISMKSMTGKTWTEVDYPALQMGMHQYL